MNKCVKFSVIIPAYNCEKTISKCLKSILDQSYKNIEIIIIDDGSSDNTFKICSDFKNKDNRIILKTQKNKGVSCARNEGLAIATGEYISFIDSDDYLEKDALYQILKIIQLYKCDIVKFQKIKETSKKNFLSKNSSYGLFSIKQDKNKILNMYFKYHDFDCVITSVFKAKLLKLLKFDTRFFVGEDYLFYFYALKNANTIFVSEKLLYHYVYDSQSLTNNLNLDKLISKLYNHIDIDEILFKELNKINASEFLIYNNKSSYNVFKTYIKLFSYICSYKQFKDLIENIINSHNYIHFYNTKYVMYKRKIKRLIKYKKFFYIIFKVEKMIKEFIKNI